MSDLMVRELAYWAASAGNAPPKAAVLVNEYMGNEDLDGNGLIYGVDFHIGPGKPPMLNSMPENGSTLTWQQYLNSL